MSPSSGLPRMLFAITALVAVTTLAVWLSDGAHLGWTKNTVTEMQHDAVTGIDYPVTRDEFVAGVDVLAAGAVATFALGTSALLLARRQARKR